MRILICFILFLGFTYSSHSKESVLQAKDTVMVELVSIIPNIVLDVRYATENNFTGKVLYPSDRIFLRRIVADSLLSVQKRLEQQGYYLAVFDGYRPLSVQKKMWELLPDPNYVADPKVGSKHNRGAAVDLTIIDSTGNYLDMGTEFDDFSEKSAVNYKDLPENVLRNRQILINAMEASGFLTFESEWWHFDFYLWEHFNISDFDIVNF